MMKARNKTDLIIEIWEALDCENVGAAEIIEIEKAVSERFGKAAVDSPMIIARLLADEGAELRHQEIMRLYIERVSHSPYDAAFRNIVDISGLGPALATIRQLENLRRKFHSDGDREGLRLVRERAISAKNEARTAAERGRNTPTLCEVNVEISEWFTIWLQSPELFENWIALRCSSSDFSSRFGASMAAKGE